MPKSRGLARSLTEPAASDGMPLAALKKPGSIRITDGFSFRLQPDINLELSVEESGEPSSPSRSTARFSVAGPSRAVALPSLLASRRGRPSHRGSASTRTRRRGAATRPRSRRAPASPQARRCAAGQAVSEQCRREFGAHFSRSHNLPGSARDIGGADTARAAEALPAKMAVFDPAKKATEARFHSKILTARARSSLSPEC